MCSCGVFWGRSRCHLDSASLPASRYGLPGLVSYRNMYVANKEVKLVSLKPLKKVEGSDNVHLHSAAVVNCQTVEISSDGQRGTAPDVNPPSGLHVDIMMEVFQSINCVRIWKRLMAVWERFVKSVRRDHEAVSCI